MFLQAIYCLRSVCSSVVCDGGVVCVCVCVCVCGVGLRSVCSSVVFDGGVVCVVWWCGMVVWCVWYGGVVCVVWWCVVAVIWCLMVVCDVCGVGL